MWATVTDSSWRKKHRPRIFKLDAQAGEDDDEIDGLDDEEEGVT